MEIEGRALPAAGAATVDEDGTGQLELAAGMLGLPGFRVLACAEFEGELQVQVETTQDLLGRPSCAAVAVLHLFRPGELHCLQYSVLIAQQRNHMPVDVEQLALRVGGPGHADTHYAVASRAFPFEGLGHHGCCPK